MDRETSLFYGSAVVECGIDAATKAVARAKLYPTKLRGRKLRLGFGPGAGGGGRRRGSARPVRDRRPVHVPSNSEMTTLGPGLSRPLTRRPPARRPESNTAAPGDSTAHDARGPYPIGRRRPSTPRAPWVCARDRVTRAPPCRGGAGAEAAAAALDFLYKRVCM